MKKYTDFVKIENDSILVDCDCASKFVIALIREDENLEVSKINETSYDDYNEFIESFANQLTAMKIAKKYMFKCHVEIGSFKVFSFYSSEPLSTYKLVVIGAKGDFSALKEVYDTVLDKPE